MLGTDVPEGAVPVTRRRRGAVQHVVHETLSGSDPRYFYALCAPKKRRAREDQRGVPTCARCLKLDDPTKLEGTRFTLALAALRVGSVDLESAPARLLARRDYIDGAGALTRRGRLVALDFLKGAAPWIDKRGVAHKREHLASVARCGAGDLDLPDPLTTERYGALREIAPAVTCLFCARMP